MSSRDPLGDLTDRLEQTAARLRAGELAPEEAATLVEACAQLAGEAAHELERRARAAADVSAPGQGELLAP
jgi:hypothetical protein